MPQAATRGVAITMAGSAVARVLSFVTQLVVGWYLTDEEVGIFATAMGVYGVTALLRAGGTHHILAAMRPEEFEERSGAFFWIGAAVCAFGTALTWGAALLTPAWYGQDHLGATLVFLGLQLLFNAVGQQARAGVQVHLRFRQLALVDVLMAVVRLAGCWYLAMRGWGPLALAIPNAAALLMETIYCIAIGGLPRRAFRATSAGVRQAAHELRPALMLGLLATLYLQGDYFTGSLFVGASALGYYYFAYQFASQPSMLLTVSLQSVFTPAMARVRGDLERERRVILHVLEASALVIPAIGMGLAAVFPALQQLCWGTKWEASDLPVYLLSVGLSLATVQSVLTGPLIGLRRWRDIVAIEGWRAGGVVVGAAIGGAIAWALDAVPETQAWILAAGVAVCSGIVSFQQVARVARSFNIPLRVVSADLLRALLIAILSATAAHTIGDAVAAPFMQAMGGGIADAVAFVSTGSVYVLLVIFCARLGTPQLLSTSLDYLPARFQPLARRILVL